MKKLVILFLSLLCLVCVVGCNDTEPANKYYITFKQDGQQDIVKEVLEGESLTDIPTPAPKTGYIVTWDVEDFTNITEDMTVNAVETVKTFTIHYDVNGGQAISETTQITYGEVFNLKTTVKEGYIFDGYEYDGQKITSPVWFFDSEDLDVTVKFLWKYSITFRQTGYADIVIELPENQKLSEEQMPTPHQRVGYQISWSIQDFSSISSTTLVTAVEKPNKYRIYYTNISQENIPQNAEVLVDSQGRYYYEVTFNQEFDKEELLKPIISDQTKIFDYWEGLDFIDGTSWDCPHDVEVSPVYRNNTYTWYFVIDGEQKLFTNVSVGESLAKDFPLIPVLPQREGYIVEWDTKFWKLTSGGGTVRPLYTPIKYNVTFMVGENETVEVVTRQFVYGQPYSLNNNATSGDGQISIGWAYNGELFPEHAEAWTMLPEPGTVVVDPVTEEHIPVEITLTPIWKCKVTFSKPDGDIIKYVNPGEILTDIPPVYAHEDYRYEWNFDFSKPITENTVVELREKIIKVTLITNGGTVSTTYLEVRYGREYTLPNVKFKNFEFDGWLYNDEEIDISGIWKIDVDSIVLTAKRGAYFTGNY